MDWILVYKHIIYLFLSLLICLSSFQDKLPNVKLRTTHRMSSGVFSELCKLGAGLKKKGKKGKKKVGFSKSGVLQISMWNQLLYSLLISSTSKKLLIN